MQLNFSTSNASLKLPQPSLTLSPPSTLPLNKYNRDGLFGFLFRNASNKDLFIIINVYPIFVHRGSKQLTHP